MRTKLGIAFMICTVCASGCAGGQAPSVAASSPPAAPSGGAPTCAPLAKSSVVPLGTPRAGSTIVLARAGQRRIAFVADEDARAVTAIDVDEKKELATTPLDGAPSQIMMTADGRLLALLRDRGSLLALVPSGDGALAAQCSVQTASEPVALAAAPDDRTVVVTSGWGRALGAYDAGTLVRRYEVPLGREPRAVVVSDDGTTAFVTHAVGSRMSAVTLGDAPHTVKVIAMRGADPSIMRNMREQRALLGKQSTPPEFREQLEKMEKRAFRSGCQGFALAKSVAPAGRVLAPQVLVDPGDPEGRPEGYGDDHTETEVSSIPVVDERSQAAFDSSLATVRTEILGKREARDHRADCLLPRAAAVDPRTHALFVGCYGIDAVIAYDAASASPATSERRRWTVGSGPSGLVVDPDKPQLFVWSQFDRSMSIVPLGEPELREKDVPASHLAKVAIVGKGQKLPTEIALGRMIFHSAGDTRIASDGRACASCHPDGRDDALTWATPEGPRRSIFLAGRVAATPPYAWNGSSKTLHEHIGKTFDRLNGSGLRSLELDALVAYITSLAPPPSTGAASDEAIVRRGASLFASKETGCAGCHVPGAGFTDGLPHDVTSKVNADRTARFDTPSLHLIGGTGPYFHDGRYADLGALLRGVDGTMGHTSHLAPNDLAALEAYLRTL